MKRIIKGNEPVEFTSKKSRYTKWKDCKGYVKRQLRASLCRDQYFLCCYCGKRIDPLLCNGANGQNNVVIEHLKPKCAYTDLMFDYTNLIASCNGNKYQSYRESGYNKEDWYTCDTAKDDEEIKVSPLDPNCEDRTIVSRRGKLIIKNLLDTDFEDTISKLHLNAKVLRFEREKVIGIYFKDSQSLTNKQYIEKVISRMDKVDSNGQLPAFSYQVKSFAKNLL